LGADGADGGLVDNGDRDLDGDFDGAVRYEADGL
jgi:hypothetical protein